MPGPSSKLKAPAAAGAQPSAATSVTRLSAPKHKASSADDVTGISRGPTSGAAKNIGATATPKTAMTAKAKSASPKAKAAASPKAAVSKAGVSSKTAPKAKVGAHKSSSADDVTGVGSRPGSRGPTPKRTSSSAAEAKATPKATALKGAAPDSNAAAHKSTAVTPRASGDKKKPAPTPPPKNLEALGKAVAMADAKASSSLAKPPSRKRPSSTVGLPPAQKMERSASANDILPVRPRASSTGGQVLYAPASVSFELTSGGGGVGRSRMAAELVEDVRSHFGDEVGAKVLAVLGEHELWDQDDVGSYDDKDGLILSAALIGFRPVQLGKLKDWIRIKRDEERGVFAAHSPQPPQQISGNGQPGRPAPLSDGASLRALLPRATLPPPRFSGMSASVDSVLGGDGDDDKSVGPHNPMARQDRASGAASTGATVAQLVGRRFKACEGQAQVSALLSHHMVEHEDDLGYVGPAVLETAKAGGAGLNLMQINVLEEWVSSVQRRMRDGRRSFQDILFDPVAAKAEEDALADQLGVAVRASRAAGCDPEKQRQAKAKAALAMYHLSMKKRHFKGLRPEDGDGMGLLVAPPVPWGREHARSASGTNF